MKRILIFSGTTEGRELAEFLRNRQVDVIVSVLPQSMEEIVWMLRVLLM